MEIRGVSSTTAIRPTTFQPTEAGNASPSGPTGNTGTAANGETEKSPGTGYISPFLRYDQGARVAVLYFRDFDTGETQDQIPSRRVVEEYRRTASRLPQENERKSATAKSGPSSPNGSTDGSTNNAGTTAGTGSGSGSGSAGPSIGVSFASGTGTTAVSSAAVFSTAVSSGAAPTTGGSPGGLVSVTV